MGLLLAVVLALNPSSNHVVLAPTVERPGAFKGESKCPNATSHFARKGSVYRGDPAKPKKLTELPDAEAYAAVYRLENGCAVPVLYREVRQVRPPKR